MKPARQMRRHHIKHTRKRKVKMIPKAKGKLCTTNSHTVIWVGLDKYRLSLKNWRRRMLEVCDPNLSRDFLCVVYEGDPPHLAFFQPVEYFSHISERDLNSSYIRNVSDVPPVHTRTFKDWWEKDNQR